MTKTKTSKTAILLFPRPIRRGEINKGPREALQQGDRMPPSSLGEERSLIQSARVIAPYSKRINRTSEGFREGKNVEVRRRNSDAHLDCDS